MNTHTPEAVEAPATWPQPQPRKVWPFKVQRKFIVRYGQDAPFEVMAPSADVVWAQHQGAALLQRKGLSVRPLEEA